MPKASGTVKDYGVEIPADGCVQRANAGYLAPGQTKISVNIDNIVTTGNTTVPLPTPPAGKMWMLTDLSMSHTVSTAQRFAVTVGGITVWSLPCHGSLAPDIAQGMETQIDVPQGQAPAVAITGAANMNSYVNIAGVQQNFGVG